MKTATLFLFIFSSSVMATDGINCTSIDGKFSLYTEEGRMEGEDDNVSRLVIKERSRLGATYNVKADFSKTKGFKEEVNVSRDDETFYMASNSRGQMITLILDAYKVYGKSLSMGYLKLRRGEILRTNFYCEVGNQ